MRDEPSPRQLKIRTTPLSVAFSVSERDAVQQAAYLAGETVSAFIRTAAVKAAMRTLSRDRRAAA